MRVLIVHNRYRFRGGEDAVVDRDENLLRSHDHEVLRYEVQNPSGLIPAAKSLALAPWNPWEARRLGAVAREFRPDVAHVHNTWFALTPAAFASLKNEQIPVVATMHNYRLTCANGMLFRDGRPCTDCVGSHAWHAVLHGCYRDSRMASSVAAGTISLNRALATWQRHVDLFIALSDFGSDKLVEMGVPRGRIYIRPNFVPDPGPRRSPPSESSKVLFVGRLSAEKGIEVILRAWEVARPSGLDLVVVGDGLLRSHTLLQGVPNLVVTGPRSPGQVSELMLSARALVFPSQWYETFGLVVVEAMAAGLPVIASDLGGIPAMLGKGGVLVAPRDGEAWAAALRSIETADGLDEMGRAGRAAYEASFTPASGIQSLEAAYDRVRLS